MRSLGQIAVDSHFGFMQVGFALIQHSMLGGAAARRRQVVEWPFTD